MSPKEVADVSEIDVLAGKAEVALQEFMLLDQEQVDFIVNKASVAALNKHIVLAKAAVEETGRGVLEDKAVKNIFACEHVTSSMRGVKTVGVIREDDIDGITEIAEPVGVIAGITPVTNPTSTAIFKSLIALKTRNPIIFAFHPSAQSSSSAAAKIVYEAAVAAGAPKNCIQWVENPSLEATSALMNHETISLILATGGNAMVKAAYSCGKPALGVGAGNVPAFVASDADLGRAVNDVVLSKAFDNGVVCASEQAVILEDSIYDEAMSLFKKQKAYVASADEKKLLDEYIFGVAAGSENCAGGKLNADVVGKSPVWIAEQAGFNVPSDTSIILAEIEHVGKTEPLSREKLSPVLAVLRAKDDLHGVELARQMVELDGLGHSAAIHSSSKELVSAFADAVKVVRVIENSPSALGGIGDIYNSFIPSLTLGCGSYGRNSLSNNVSAVNLVNVKRVGRRNNNMQWFKVPSKIYFEPNSIKYLTDMPNVERVTIVTDATMTKLGFVDKVIDVLRKRSNGVSIQIIDDTEPEPSIHTVKKNTEIMRGFNPDTIIALGGGSPMDASKVMWLLYEHPEIDFSDTKEKFFDMRKRAFKFPTLGSKAHLVCIPTTSGTGAEVTPFAVITGEDGVKYPLADYALTPTVAIVDPVLTGDMPGFLVADSGFDALTHATEAYVSVYANDYTDALALQAIKLIFENIENSVKNGDKKTREKMHNASTIAGMAFANAFLGIVHALAHTVGSKFHLPHGRTNAVLLPHVIRYNGQIPTKLSAWPKYEKYIAHERFQDIAKVLGLPHSTPEEAVEAYAQAVEDLRDKVNMPASFSEQGVNEEEFLSQLEEIALLAYGDQCAPANPRMPMIEDMKDILKKSL